MSKDRFEIGGCLNPCDCCGSNTDHAADAENYSLTTSLDYSKTSMGLILCSYCMLMLKYKLDEFNDKGPISTEYDQA